jgi:hypothetical protein
MKKRVRNCVTWEHLGLLSPLTILQTRGIFNTISSSPIRCQSGEKRAIFPAFRPNLGAHRGPPDRAVFARLGWDYARCRRSCPTSQIGVGFARFPINGSRAITRFPLRSFVSFVVKGSWFSDLARCRRSVKPRGATGVPDEPALGLAGWKFAAPQPVILKERPPLPRMKDPNRRSPLYLPPPPSPVIPDWRRLARGASQIIPDWRSLQR